MVLKIFLHILLFYLCQQFVYSLKCSQVRNKFLTQSKRYTIELPLPRHEKDATVNVLIEEGEKGEATVEVEPRRHRCYTNVVKGQGHGAVGAISFTYNFSNKMCHHHAKMYLMASNPVRPISVTIGGKELCENEESDSPAKLQYHDPINTLNVRKDPLSGPSCDSFAVIKHSWGAGAEGRIQFKVPEAVRSWKLLIEFKNSPIGRATIDESQLIKRERRCKYVFRNQNYNGRLTAGSTFDHRFQYSYLNRKYPKPKISYIKFMYGTKHITCGVPTCNPPTTKPPSNVTTTRGTTTTKKPIDPLSGDTCSKFLRLTQRGPGMIGGKFVFSVPKQMYSWRLKVGFKPTFGGFQVQQGANLQSIRKVCDGTVYYYLKADNRVTRAGSVLQLPYFINYDQNKAAPSIAYIYIGNGQHQYSCGIEPQCLTTTTTTTTAPPTTTTRGTTTTKQPIDPLSGDTCSKFLRLTQKGPGMIGGKFVFSVPKQMYSWRLKVGFKPTFGGFQVQQGANLQSMRKVCDGTVYYYLKADNRVTRAGSVLQLPYFINYDQNKAAPSIAYIYIGNDQHQYSCGIEPQCLTTTTTTTTIPLTTTTPLPTNTTRTRTRTTQAPTTTTATTTTTEEPVTELSGDRCSKYLSNVNEGFNDEIGVMKFRVPVQSNSWRLKVGFSSSLPVDGMQVNNGNLQSPPGEKCQFDFTNYQWDTYKANSIFKKSYRFWSNKQMKFPRPLIQYIEFSSGSFTMSCGILNCAIPGNVTTTTTTTTPPITVPPLSGNVCDAYIEVPSGDNTPGQIMGNIRVLVPRTMWDWQILVGFKKPVNGFDIQADANRITTNDTCPRHLYVFQNSDRSIDIANTILVFPFSLSYDQNLDKPKIPKIDYIMFSDSNKRESCGIKPECPKTTATTTTTTTTTVVPVTTTEEPASTTEEPATRTEKPATTTEQPAMSTEEQATTTTTKAPETTTEEPTTTTEEPGTTTQEPATTTKETATTTEEAATTTEEAATTTAKPATSTEEPATTTEKAATTSKAPEMTTEEPITKTEKSEATTEEPAMSTEEPATTTTTKAPEITTEETTTTTKEPGTTTQEPATTTKETATTIKAPETTTEEAATTTEEAATTTEEAATTTAKPATSTEEPATTTEKAATTSKAPDMTTEEPITKTEKSEATTEEPAMSTEEPATTTATKTPESKTEKPTTTTEEPGTTTQEPATTAKEPATITEKTSTTTKALEMTTAEPVTTTEESAATTEEPATATAKPATATAKPATQTAEPATTTKESATTTEEPATATAKPATATAKPATQTAEPATTTKESATTTEEPATTTKEPATSTEEPATTTKTFTTTEKPTCKLPNNLTRVLSSSIDFYKAQRTGVLPDNDISWRRDSFTNDGQREGVDLSGGYFDAGDFMKFNFPAAAATTILAWGMLEFGEGYKFAGLHNEGSATLKWATDYFVKCHTGPNELWGQCGIGREDHSVWGREDEYYTLSGKDNPRPCFKIDQSKPGSDLAGETAAALAATSMVFKDSDSTYSETLLQHARQLYDFAKHFRGKYSDSIPDAASFYNSFSGYMDELAWSASWLYKATGEAAYLTDAENFYNSMQQNAPEFSWDNKGRGVAILLSQLSNNAAKYQTNADSFCNQMKNSQTRTKRGIVFIQQWGSNRHAANVAFACMVLSKTSGGQFNDFARDQINKMLGDESKMERSYVVGNGFIPPTQPHHRLSSCPRRPAPCGWNEYNLSTPNPFVLNGALVGGVRSPTEDYTDSRQDFVRNEVALDYNSGFQSAVAGLLSLQQAGDCGVRN